MAAPNESLATAFQHCRQSFDTILKQLDVADGGELSKATWEDEASRLRLWGSNIGATSRANTSLDFRLRDADTVRQQIYKNLSNLDEALNEALECMKDLAPSSFNVDGFPASYTESATKANVADPPPRNESTSKDSSDNEDDLVEDAEASLEDLQAAFQDVVSLINSLFRMTLYIRNPSRRDQLKQRDTSAVANFEMYDVSHVENKFPKAEHTLTRRLGQANTVRRANLRYWERHHKKLAYDETVNDQATVAPLSESVATTFKPVEVEEQHDTRSHFSGTSYMESLLGGESVRRPDLPDVGKNGMPFQCPICCYIITVSGQREWMKHVFYDLQPYVCVFKDCKTPLLLHENRRDWFAHVLNNHLCPNGSGSLLQHLQCPLCNENVRSMPMIRRHLPRHLEEIALFSLPNSLFGEETEMVDDDRPEEHSSDEEVIGEGLQQSPSLVPTKPPLDNPRDNWVEEQESPRLLPIEPKWIVRKETPPPPGVILGFSPSLGSDEEDKPSDDDDERALDEPRDPQGEFVLAGEWGAHQQQREINPQQMPPQMRQFFKNAMHHWQQRYLAQVAQKYGGNTGMLNQQELAQINILAQKAAMEEVRKRNGQAQGQPQAQAGLRDTADRTLNQSMDSDRPISWKDDMPVAEDLRRTANTNADRNVDTDPDEPRDGTAPADTGGETRHDEAESMYTRLGGQDRPVDNRSPKTSRFNIPKERTLENIDDLIKQSTDEQEKKALKQQKRLLRNRQAA